MFEVFKQLI